MKIKTVLYNDISVRLISALTCITLRHCVDAHVSVGLSNCSMCDMTAREAVVTYCGRFVDVAVLSLLYAMMLLLLLMMMMMMMLLQRQEGKLLNAKKAFKVTVVSHCCNFVLNDSGGPNIIHSEGVYV